MQVHAGWMGRVALIAALAAPSLAWAQQAQDPKDPARVDAATQVEIIARHDNGLASFITGKD